VRYFVPLYIIILFTSCNHPENVEYGRFRSKSAFANSGISYENEDLFKIIAIKDGDTFVVLFDRREQVVRLEHIDCPEKKQPFGSKAKEFVSNLCFGKKVHLNHNYKFDRNKRLIAEVILENGININKELVANGLAWHYKKYSDNKQYAELEEIARANKIGIWSEPNAVAPWNWRKK
jgi:micrococcal nuclease